MKKLWTPEDAVEKPSDKMAKQVRQYMYENWPELKKLADKIHHGRMMGGPACDECIIVAINQLGQH